MNKRRIALDKKRKVNIKQQTAYPLEGNIRLRIDSGKPEAFTVALRIPAWSKDNSECGFPKPSMW
jgi:DUF1680 family protein